MWYWGSINAAFVVAIALIGASQVHTEKATTWFTEALGVQEVKAETKQEAVEETIRRLAKEANFRWPDYLVRLAYCESRFDPNATNDNGQYGLDRGPFQINNFYHKEVTDKQAFDLEWSTKWTMERINKGYQHEWACDQIIRKK